MFAFLDSRLIELGLTAIDGHHSAMVVSHDAGIPKSSNISTQHSSLVESLLIWESSLRLAQTRIESGLFITIEDIIYFLFMRQNLAFQIIVIA